MIALIISPIYLLLMICIMRLFLKWGDHFMFLSSDFYKVIVIIVAFILITIPITSLIIAKGKIHYLLKKINNFWIGFMYFTFMTLGITFIFYGVLRLCNEEKAIAFEKEIGIFVVVIISVLVIIGIIQGQRIKKRKYTIISSKECNTKIGLISDLHLGINSSRKFIKKMVQKINEENYDIVLIAGDIFDNNYYEIDEPLEYAKILKDIKSKYGVYAVFGNHDIHEKILVGFTFKQSKTDQEEIMKDFFQASNITLLEDEAILINNKFYLIGRKDISKCHKMKEKRKEINELVDGLDNNFPIILMDHQPKDFHNCEGIIKLHVSGHVHNGQLFPNNLIMKLLWENSYGYKKIGTLDTVVSSGIGLWGTEMRFFTSNEIVTINWK